MDRYTLLDPSQITDLSTARGNKSNPWCRTTFPREHIAIVYGPSLPIHLCVHRLFSFTEALAISPRT